MTVIRLMPERSCPSCTRQAEWGCTAKRWRFPDEGEPDGPENWVDPAYLPIEHEDGESWACPRQHLKENPVYWNAILKFYGMFRKGFLPDRGAIADQSNKAVEVFRILEDANEACEAELARRAREQQGRQGEAAGPRG